MQQTCQSILSACCVQAFRVRVFERRLGVPGMFHGNGLARSYRDSSLYRRVDWMISFLYEGKEL